MLYYTILYYTKLYYTILYYTIPTPAERETVGGASASASASASRHFVAKHIWGDPETHYTEAGDQQTK